jgi:LuxR family maltose regulon positive regulatory protein
LCDAVVDSHTEQRRAQQLLETFRQRNLFLVALDGEGRWFRFHHLFRSLLEHQLELTHTAAEIAELHARAGRWFAAEGSVEAALRYSLAAGDDLYAAQLVERNVHAALNREAWRELEQWLVLLPDAVKQRPALLVAQAWLEQFRYRFAAISPLLERAQRNLAAAPSGTAAEDAELMGSIYALSAVIANLGGTPADILHASTLALEVLPPHLVFARGMAEHYQLRAVMQSGDLAGAVHKTQQALVQIAQPNGRMLRLLLALCAMYFDYGDPAALESTAIMYRRVAQQLQQPLSIAWANACLGWAYYQRNDLENARTHFTTVIDAPYAAHIRAVIESFTGLALVLCAENQRGQAHIAADGLATWLVESGLVSQLPFAAALSDQIDLASGITPPVRPTVLPDSVDFAGLESWLMPALVQVQLWLHGGSAGDLASAEQTLRKCRAQASVRNFQRRIIEIDALDALRCAALGQREEALTLLAQSVTGAESRGALRILLDLGPALHPLLQELLARNAAPAFIRRLLVAYRPVDETSHAPLPAYPPARVLAATPIVGPVDKLLTNREFDVLLLLVQRLTNKEIAKILFLSPRTVKKHTTNIYQKLHVANRRAAVSEARARGILPVA